MARSPSQLERRVGGRTAKDYAIAIAYDGLRTEDEYFRGWSLVMPRSQLTIFPFFVKSGGNPLKAVGEVKKKKGKLGRFAEIWCVCDVDDTTPDIVAQAVVEADAAGIRLCLSNRCFEIWIALHFVRSDQPVLTEDDAVALVQQHIPEYGGDAKSAHFDRLLPKTLAAITNGQWLEDRGHINPATSVHALARKLRDNLPPEFREQLEQVDLP